MGDGGNHAYLPIFPFVLAIVSKVLGVDRSDAALQPCVELMQMLRELQVTSTHWITLSLIVVH